MKLVKHPQYQQSRPLPRKALSEYGCKGPKIGSGGHGVVYQYGQYAVKVYNRLDDIRAPREIAILRRCSHEHVIELVDVVDEGTTIKIVLPLMAGDLSNWLLSNRSREEREHLIPQLVSGIDYLHQIGILHLDLKPGNVLVDGDRLMLADFSCSRESKSTLNHRYIVSLFYKPPELLLEMSHLDYEKVDIWSLGCIIFEIYTGVVLFKGDSELGQLFVIFRLLDTPSEATWPGISRAVNWRPNFPRWKGEKGRYRQNVIEQLPDWIDECLWYDPKDRISASRLMRLIDVKKNSLLGTNRESYPVWSEHRCRSISLSWIFEVIMGYNYDLRIFGMTCWLFDSIIDFIAPKNAQRYVVSAFNIAAGYADNFDHREQKLADDTDGSVTPEEIDKTTKEILTLVDYDLQQTLSCDYLDRNDERWELKNLVLAFLYLYRPEYCSPEEMTRHAGMLVDGYHDNIKLELSPKLVASLEIISKLDGGILYLIKERYPLAPDLRRVAEKILQLSREGISIVT